MIKRRWLLVMLLAVPILGAGVAARVRLRYDAQVRKATLEARPETSQEELADATLDHLCKTSSRATRGVCRTNLILKLMFGTSVAAALAGIALICGIGLAGVLAKGSRDLLVEVFLPGMYGTAICVVVLVLVHASIAVVAIYYGGVVFFGSVLTGVIAAIAVGAGLGAFKIAGVMWAVVKRAEHEVLGRSIGRNTAPALWARVEAVAKTLGACVPDHLVAGLDGNFFVTEADVHCIGESLGGRTLYCSLPLCRILDVDEFAAILGHELGHFKGNDTKFSQRFYPIYRGTTSSIAAIQSSAGSGAMLLPLLPALGILSYYLECFAVAERRLSRDRELAADAAGASVTNNLCMASALAKVHAFSARRGELEDSVASVLREGDGTGLVNVSKSFALLVAELPARDWLKGIADTQLAHPTDSHPPLAARLDALGPRMDRLASAEMNVRPSKPASALIPEVEQIEEELSVVYKSRLADKLGIAQEGFQRPPRRSGHLRTLRF